MDDEGCQQDLQWDIGILLLTQHFSADQLHPTKILHLNQEIPQLL